jgi:hypothetical protein
MLINRYLPYFCGVIIRQVRMTYKVYTVPSAHNFLSIHLQTIQDLKKKEKQKISSSNDYLIALNLKKVQ